MKTVIIEKKCIQCGRAFVTQYAHSKFCSSACQQKHYRENRLISIKCETCGKEFNGKYRGAIYCSKECREKGRKGKMEQLYNTKKAVLLQQPKYCEFCGKMFMPASGAQKYCKSPECTKKHKQLMNCKKSHGEEAARIKKRRLKKQKFSFSGDSPSDYGRQQAAETQAACDRELHERRKKWLEERQKNEGKTWK